VNADNETFLLLQEREREREKGRKKHFLKSFSVQAISVIESLQLIAKYGLQGY